MSEPEPRGQHEQETASGRFVDLLLPRPEAVALDDVAHGLSQAVRFAGATRDGSGEPVHYSVAEHCILVARRLEVLGHPGKALAGLHHDDGEYLLGDVTRPLKLLLRQLSCSDHDLTWDAIEEGVARACWGSLSGWRPGPPATALWEFADQHCDEVVGADVWAAVVEARLLLPSEAEHWTRYRLEEAWGLNLGHPDSMVVPDRETLLRQGFRFGLPAPVAKRLWLGEHERLVARARSNGGHEGARRDVEAE